MQNCKMTIISHSGLCQEGEGEGGIQPLKKIPKSPVAPAANILLEKRLHRNKKEVFKSKGISQNQVVLDLHCLKVAKLGNQWEDCRGEMGWVGGNVDDIFMSVLRASWK